MCLYECMCMYVYVLYIGRVVYLCMQNEARVHNTEKPAAKAAAPPPEAAPNGRCIYLNLPCLLSVISRVSLVILGSSVQHWVLLRITLVLVVIIAIIVEINRLYIC